MGVNDPFALLEGAMPMPMPMPMAFEGIGIRSLCGYNDFNLTVDQLNTRLVELQWEFEAFKINARDEMRRKEVEIQKLLETLQAVSQQRDEAREQLQTLAPFLKKFMPMNMSNSAAEISPVSSYLQPESPRRRPARAGSGTTESDSYSDTCNRQQSYVSSPVESFFDTNTSPDLPGINMADSGHIAVPNKPMYNNNSHNFSVGLNPDQFSVRIERLVSKRPLPEKGKLMDAVMQAGPLLQNLLVSGPLPRWKNPPPPQQLQIPPVSVNGQNSQTLNQTAALGPRPLLHASLNALHVEAAMKRPMELASPCGAYSFQSPNAKKQKSQ